MLSKAQLLSFIFVGAAMLASTSALAGYEFGSVPTNKPCVDNHPNPQAFTDDEWRNLGKKASGIAAGNAYTHLKGCQSDIEPGFSRGVEGLGTFHPYLTCDPKTQEMIFNVEEDFRCNYE